MVMTEQKKEIRINKVAKLAEGKGLTRPRFLIEAQYKTGISRTTLSKAYNGETDLDIETVIKLAQFFGVQFKDVLEIKL
jgi:transcriptional regulator with XRE-family HTH domain